MDRHLHKKYIPTCNRNIPLISQYLWKDKDTNKYKCHNGISHPIYDCKGWVNFSLPLELYPKVNEIHPQIEMTRRMHLNWREDPTRLIELRKRNDYESFQFDKNDYDSGRLEGFYTGNLGDRSSLEIISDRVPGYPLASPYGNTRGSRSGCSACS